MLSLLPLMLCPPPEYPDLLGPQTAWQRADCRVQRERPDVRITIEQRGKILGDPSYLRADLRVDAATGLYQVDFETWFLDSRETRPKWKPRASLVGPIGPSYRLLGDESPFDVTGSFITASAYSNSQRIVSAAGNPGARWIALADDPASSSFGLLGIDFFRYVSVGQSGEDWGDAEYGGATRYEGGLPRTVTLHSRDDGLDADRVNVTFDWRDQQVASLPAQSAAVSMRRFVTVKQSVDWRSVLRSYRDSVAFSTCLNNDPTFWQPIGTPKLYGTALWRSRLRAFGKEMSLHGWPAPIKARSVGKRRATVWFKDPLIGVKRSATIVNPITSNRKGYGCQAR